MSDESNVEEFGRAKPKRVLIDGDVLVHMACWQKPLRKDAIEKKQKEIDILRHFKEHEKADKAQKKLDEASLTWQPTLRKAQNRYKHFMRHVLTSNRTDEFSIAIGNPKNNWRLDIHPEYKLHKGRTGGKPRAPYIQELRMWAVDYYDGHYCEGYEADDAIRIWATRLGLGNYVVCSVDKDLNLIPGHHFNPKEQNISKQSWYMEPEASAMFFWEQMLTGDSIDNIPGIKGIGPKKAEAILEPCSNEQECKEAVVRQYDLKYGEEGYEQLLFNGQLLHIWTTKGDKWSFDQEEYEQIISSESATEE